MRRMARWTGGVWVALLFVTSGCSDGPGSASDGGGTDGRTGRPEAGPRPDGSRPDGAAPDATRPPEGGARDARIPEGGFDARVPGCTTLVRTIETGREPSRRLHVATSGADRAGCGSEAEPCATPAYAVRRAEPGTAVVIHPGTYPGGWSVENLAGRGDAPIWIGGAPGEDRPIIRGGANAFHLIGARYVIVHDLEITGTDQNGINVDDGGQVDDPDRARWLLFRDLYIHDVGGSGNQDCLKLSGIDDYQVLDSRFARCGGGNAGSAIDHVGCHRGLIARNRFEDQTGSGNAVQCKGGSEDIEIRANLFVDPGPRGVNMGGSTSFRYFRPPLASDRPNFEARDIRVLANVFVRPTAAVGFVGCVDCVAANNTIVNPQNWVLRILQETTTSGGYEFLPASNGRFVNNIVYFDGSVRTAVNVGPDTDAASFEFANNLWYRHDRPDRSAPPGDLPVTERDGIVGEDPRFVGSDDYRLSPGSSAIGAGRPLDELTVDMSWRCFANPPSIGAHEGAS